MTKTIEKSSGHDMTKVLLINPPYPFWEGVPVSLSLTYLASVLEEDGVEVEILDLLTTSYSPQKVENKIESFEPDIIGATCVTRSYPQTLEILQHCKEVDQDIPIIVGGPHVTFTPQETLEEAEWIDFVVKGEGEYTLKELVRKIDGGEKDFESVKGIAYRDDKGKVVINQGREPIENLDEIPFPARDLLPLAKYRALGSRCDIITSRGCPFNCIFCVAPRMFGKKVRFRDPKSVLDEMEEVLDLGFEINFADDTFTLNHDHVYAILDEIIDRGLDITWTANGRVDTVDRELLRRMKEAGCTSIFYGVESGDPEVLDTSKKGITHDQVEEAVEITKDVGLHVITSYILGLPGETTETMDRTLEFADNLGTDYTVHVLAPLPGTELYENRDEYGIRLLSEEWEEMNADEPVTETITEDGKIGPEDISKALNKYLGRTEDSRRETEAGAKAGDEESKVEAEKWKTLDFLTPLIKEDLVERKGKINLEGEEPGLELSAQLFAEKISGEFEDPSFSIIEQLKKQVKEENLTTSIEKNEGGRFLVWEWSDL